MTNRKRLLSLTRIGLGAALLCVLSPISIPLGDVPLSLATLVIFILAQFLGPWKNAVAVAVYLAVGAVGLPVFSGFTGGIGRIIGPTGGFLMGYLILAILSGFGKEIAHRIVFMAVGTLILYAVGAVWYSLWADVPPLSAVALCVLPCIPFDIVKLAVGAVVFWKLPRRWRV